MSLLSLTTKALGAVFPARLYVYCTVALVLFGAGSYSAWQVQNWRHAGNKLDAAIATINTGSKQANTDNKAAKERVKTVTAYKQGATKIVEKIVYETIQNPSAAVCDNATERLSDITELVNHANSAR